MPLPIITAALLAQAAVAAPTAAGSVAARFGQLPTIENLAVSPDGSKVAVIVGSESQREVQVLATATQRVLRMTPPTDAKIRALTWAGNDHLLVTKSTTERLGGWRARIEMAVVVDINIATGEAKNPVHGTNLMLRTVTGVPTVRMVGGRPAAFVTGYGTQYNNIVSKLVEIHLDSGFEKVVAEGVGETSDFILDGAGAYVGRVDYNSKSGQWQLWTGKPGAFVKSIEEDAPIEQPWVSGIGRDPQTLLIGRNSDTFAHYSELRIGGTAPGTPLPQIAGQVFHDPKTGLAIGSMTTGAQDNIYRFFEPNDQKLWTAVKRAFPGEMVTIMSWSDDRQTLALKVEGEKDGSAFYVLDLAGGHANWIGDEYAGVPAEAMSPVKTISYRAADGLEIPAYLTLPRDKPAEKLPLVVLVHGGPEARDEPGFDWWSQAIAALGYAVLRPEFRGSTGFTRSFFQAGLGQWGKAMQTDLSDGVAHLAKQGVIDPARVCIVGASYGGYAALAGVALQHGVYKCAVSLAGPSDLRKMLAFEEGRAGGKSATLRYWKRFMGAASANDPALDQISPAVFAAKVDAPVLILHGDDDTVVPVEQSRIMQRALQKAGRPVEFVSLAKEDHWLSRGATRTQMLVATTAFLQANLH